MEAVVGLSGPQSHVQSALELVLAKTGLRVHQGGLTMAGYRTRGPRVQPWAKERETLRGSAGVRPSIGLGSSCQGVQPASGIEFSCEVNGENQEVATDKQVAAATNGAAARLREVMVRLEARRRMTWPWKELDEHVDARRSRRATK